MMNDEPGPHWNPADAAVLRDQPAAYDEMRRRCPVAHSEQLGWSLFRHEDVTRVLLDHETFSNQVSKYRSVPNGMDPPEHTAYRRAIEPYFTAGRMRLFEPVCRSIASRLLEPLVSRAACECAEEFAVPYALQCQCEFLGWPASLAASIRDWTRRSQDATRAGHRATLVAVAAEFRANVDELLRARRQPGAPPRNDVIDGLLATRIDGTPLSDEEITSILRNWTMGELGSLASSIGILAGHLAVDRDLQARLRAEPALLPAAIDEILRISGPLILNRRVAKRDVELGGRRIAAGERLSLMWIGANRDEAVFEAPEEVRLDRDPAANLLYGAGIHVCPGAPLARLELRVAMEELLRRTRRIELGADEMPRKAVFPANGWESLPLRLA
ncbi:MAG TPA: cytochrome P450 [Woeseiaceae bacterium]